MRSRTLFTIGYEGSSIADFRATLEGAQINLVIDVRDVPISRKRGFSKTALASWLASAGISYLHLKGLGDPKPGRNAAREGRFADFRRIFAAHLVSDVAQADLARAVEAAIGNKACLLCFERDHHNCHRCMVAEAMVQRRDFKLLHLGVRSGLATNRIPAFECTHGGAPAILG